MRTFRKEESTRKGVCKGPKKTGCEFLDGEGMLPLYRAQTERMLRRYFRLSLDLGRLPSFLGGEVFRGVASSSRVHTFEDFVIFVHDMERTLEALDPASLETIAALVFLDQTQEEAAKSLGLSRRQVERRYQAALDRLSRRLLMAELMRPLTLALEEPDCSVCLRNPRFSPRAEDAETTAVREGRGNLQQLPPKKPAASVRIAVAETGTKVMARASVIPMASPMWQNPAR